MALAKGWDRESADLFIHETGARISRTSYRGKMAWWFFPVSLDVPAVEHPATDEGREEAFATSVREIPKFRKVKPKNGPGKKKSTAPADAEGEGPTGGEAAGPPDPDNEEAVEDAENEDGE